MSPALPSPISQNGAKQFVSGAPSLDSPEKFPYFALMLSVSLKRCADAHPLYTVPSGWTAVKLNPPAPPCCKWVMAIWMACTCSGESIVRMLHGVLKGLLCPLLLFGGHVCPFPGWRSAPCSLVPRPSLGAVAHKVRLLLSVQSHIPGVVVSSRFRPV